MDAATAVTGKGRVLAKLSRHTGSTRLNKSNVTEEAALAQLREAYRGLGLEVRFYPDCISVMRWQLGRNGDGEHFTLMAHGETPERLLECVEARARSQARNGH